MPTVPAIANSDRLLDATATAAQDTFAITWPVIADSEDAAVNDLVVLIDGELIPSTDYEFDGTAITGLDGIWNGGDLILDTPLAGGERVIIYSDRAPRRTGYFLEGKSLPFTELDKLMDDFAVQLRDQEFRGKRAITVPVEDWIDGTDPDSIVSDILEAAETAEGAASTVSGLISGVLPVIVESATTGTPPVSPSDGDAYAIPAGATGVWSGKGGQIALRQSGAWNYLSALAGFRCFASDALIEFAAASGKWVSILSVSLAACGGVLATADAAAASVGGELVIDTPLTLGAGYTFTAKQVRFVSTIDLDDYNLNAGNAHILAGPFQIFDYSGTGRLTGTCRNSEIYPEWFGTSAGNIQYAVDHVQQASVQTTKIKLLKASYTITDTVTVSGNQHANIEGAGLYETFINFATASEKPAFKFVGTGQTSGGSLTNLTITDPSNAAGVTGLVGLQIEGAIGMYFDFATAAAKRSIVNYNSDSSTFTEFNRGIIRTAPETATALEIRCNGASVNESHHGLKLLKGTLINSWAGNPAILIDSNAIWYGGGCDVSWFCFDNPGGATDGVFIQNNSTKISVFDGTFDVERFNTGNIALAGGENIYSLGTVGYKGDQSKLFYSSLYLADRVHDALSGAAVVSLRQVNRSETTTSNAAAIAMPPAPGAQYLALIDVGGTNFHYLLLGYISTDDVSGYSWTLKDTLVSQNGAGYGSPTVGFSGGNIDVSGAWGGNSIQVKISLNHIGQGFFHHDQ